MNTPKRPKALLTLAQCICVLAIALTLIPTLLPTFMLVPYFCTRWCSKLTFIY